MMMNDGDGVDSNGVIVQPWASGGGRGHTHLDFGHVLLNLLLP